VKYAVLLLFVVPCYAAEPEDKQWTTAEVKSLVVELRDKMDLQAAEDAAEIVQLMDQIKELRRKLDAIKGRSMCS
jgi:hypothetical protein